MKTLVGLIILCLSNSVFAESWNVPVPDGVKSVWVGENMIQNGVPVKVQSFSTDMPASQIISFYKNEWAQAVESGQPGFIENQVGDWSVISRLENKTNTVIQVKKGSNGGTEGFISVSEPFATPRLSKIMKQFPKMGGTDLISATESKDFDKKATTMIFQNSFSVESNVSYYKSNMHSSGWTLNHSSAQDGTAIMLFSKKNIKSEIAINKSGSGRTTIFANVVTGD